MDITAQYPELFASLMELIRSSTALNAHDIEFVRSINRCFNSRSANASKKLLSIINELMARSNGIADSPFTNADDLLKRWRSVEHTFDLLLDKIDVRPVDARRQSSPATSSSKEIKDYMRLANNIVKPQLQFHNKIDNTLGPFKPVLTQKPWAAKPLSPSLQLQQPDQMHAQEWYDHPYRTEIEEYTAEPNDFAVTFPQWDETTFTFVDTPDALFKMLKRLEQANEIAVDVEHHDYRSYLGLVCLIQISALGEDYVVDALALRSELQILNKVFAKPAIVKILHGAKMDVLWLQRDLGIYIVGLFDTYFAARELLFPKHSLAYLLQQFAGFEAQKKFQLADWRIRPLPTELVDYARADTHFLIYIYHQLKQKLVDQGLYGVVIEESRKVALQRFETPGYNELEPAWVSFATKYRLHSQLARAILVRLFEWRDSMAREFDESPRYVMAPSMMANLCITKPATASQVLAASHNVSPIVRKWASELAKLIQDICDHPELVDTTMPERATTAGSVGAGTAVPHVLDDVSKTRLKRTHSSFMDVEEDDERDLPNVCLDVVLPSDVERAQAFNEAAAREALARADAEAVAEAEAKTEQLQRQMEREEEERRREEATRKPGKGKRINVMDNVDEYEVLPAVHGPNKRKPAADEPAFDFDAAAKVMNTQQELTKSFSQLGRSDAPKGAHKNNSRFKQARSFR